MLRKDVIIKTNDLFCRSYQDFVDANTSLFGEKRDFKAELEDFFKVDFTV